MGLQSPFNSLRGPGNLYGPRAYGTDGIGGTSGLGGQDATKRMEVQNQAAQAVAGTNFNGVRRDLTGVYDPLRPPGHQPFPTPIWSAPYGGMQPGRGPETMFPVPIRGIDGDNIRHMTTDYVPAPKIPQYHVWGTAANKLSIDANSTKPRNRYPYDQYAMLRTGQVPAPDMGLHRAPQPVLSRAPRLFYQVQIRTRSGQAFTYVGARAPTPKAGFDATVQSQARVGRNG